MRGDSRRDLYSKTLALCGLGVLAGAGALVDYWPVGVRFPVAVSPVFSPSPAVASAPAADALGALAGLLAPPRQASAVSAEVKTPPEPLIALVSYESLPMMDAAFDIGSAVELESLPAPVFVNVRHEVPTLPGAPVQLTGPAITHGLDDLTRAAVSGSSGGGFITSAFRKTGSSIVRTGVKTGSSLVDAVRVVGSVVRRALPD